MLGYNEPDMSKNAVSRGSAADAESSSPERFQLLLVEDDEVSRLYLRTLLTSLGYPVTPAESGEEALAQWKEQHFGAILLDIQLPELSGLEVASRIRAQEREQGRERVPIIALTAYSGAEDRRRIREAGMEHYLTKPTEASALEKVLSEVRGTVPAASTAARASAEPGAAAEEKAGNNEKEYGTVRSLDALEPDISPENYAERLRREFEGSEDTLVQMADMSLKEIPERLQQITRCISEGESESGAKHAHSLANVAGILFAADIRQAALGMERELRAEDLAAARRSHRQIVQQCEVLIQALRSLLNG
jgi:CheY-like chemotaxis protein